MKLETPFEYHARYYFRNIYVKIKHTQNFIIAETLQSVIIYIKLLLMYI